MGEEIDRTDIFKKLSKKQLQKNRLRGVMHHLKRLKKEVATIEQQLKQELEWMQTESDSPTPEVPQTDGVTGRQRCHWVRCYTGRLNYAVAMACT